MLATLNNDQPSLEVETGYYLIIDKKANNPDAYILNRHIAAETVKAKKVEPPKIKKEILTTGDTWSDHGDYDTNHAAAEADATGDKFTDNTQTVSFRISAPIPKGYDTIEDYYLTFYDTQDSGLKPVTEGVKVYIVKKDATALPGDRDEDGNEITTNENWTLLTGSSTPNDPNADYAIRYGATEDGKTYNFIINIDDMKSAPNSKYAELEEGDQIVVIYSTELLEGARPKEQNKAELDYEGRDKTKDKPSSIVTAYTFQLVANKLNGDESTPTTPVPLKGAEFELYKWSGDEDDTLETASAWTKFWEYKVPTKTNDEGETVPDYENAKDKFTIPGLEAGKYKLVETSAPEPFNVSDPIYIEVIPTYSDAGVLNALTIKQMDKDGKELKKEAGTITNDANEVQLDVNNYSGLVLPETGGIGTTIFYIVGGVLVVGAVVLLITKRRASADEE